MSRRNQVGVLSDVKALVKTREVHYCPKLMMKEQLNVIED